MIDRLKSWDILPQISIFFAEFLSRFDMEENVLLAGALIMRAVTENHIGVPLEFLLSRLDEELVRAGIEYNLPDAAEVSAALLKSRSCGRPGDYKPMILDNGRLYLERYYQYENILSGKLLSFSHDLEPDVRLLSILKESFSGPGTLFDEEFDPLKAAVYISAVKRLSIISGGPGTGKTTALISILKLLSMHDPDIKIVLAAPTGKATARMMEVISGKVRIEAYGTLHRLLIHKKIDADVLVIDEASMVSLPLMARTVSALNDDSRLILLGDKNQLASVEAGAFFADLIDAASGPLRDNVIELKKSFRFPFDSVVGILAKLVISESEENASNALEFVNKNSGLSDKYGLTVIRHRAVLRKGINQELNDLIIEGYRPFIEEPDISLALEKFDAFRILCAMNSGPSGAVNINAGAVQILENHGLLSTGGSSLFYKNRPVIVTQNDYTLGLYNGDTGLTRPDIQGNLRVFFRSQESDSLRSFTPSLLPHTLTVFATTVHKSQGSEFDSAALLLPSEDNRILTRELLYTGITRVRKTLHIFTEDEVFLKTILRKTYRFSGLTGRLK